MTFYFTYTFLARACHAASERAEQPFMTLNCAALPDDVAESELFGVGEKDHEESKRGIFELADGGSVFLDEVGEMSTKLQSKLLRVIQNGSFRRVDSEQEVTVNVRIISSTNKDLLNLVSLGEFREDLYYRLNVFGLNIPPLRERRSDILPLTEFFMVHAVPNYEDTHRNKSQNYFFGCSLSWVLLIPLELFAERRQCAVSSIERRNTLTKSLCWCLIV
jgi:transcriptional regulator of aroF, aroG, tyrA and aromatic amino acid transport